MRLCNSVRVLVGFEVLGPVAACEATGFGAGEGDATEVGSGVGEAAAVAVVDRRSL